MENEYKKGQNISIKRVKQEPFENPVFEKKILLRTDPSQKFFDSV
jgi:hypothetical protein